MMSFDGPCAPEWVWGAGPDADVVISTRARLARSLADIPFPARASGEDLTMVVRKVREAARALAVKFPQLRVYNVDALSREEKAFLLDAHIASVEQIQGGEGRIVVLEPSATLSIMANEEDHLRIQALMSGLVPRDAWKLVDWADDELSKGLDYGFSQKYGFLTASVSNMGTGLRISAMMHLAGLSMVGRLNPQLRAAYELGVSVRGLLGEGSQSLGGLFQVSNEITLGISEKDIVSRVSSVARYLLGEERLARKELLCDGRNRLIGKAQEALAKLKSITMVSPRDALAILSPVRLAAELELVDNCSRATFNELLMGMRAGAENDPKTGSARAELLRKKLADCRCIGT